MKATRSCSTKRVEQVAGRAAQELQGPLRQRPDSITSRTTASVR